MAKYGQQLKGVTLRKISWRNTTIRKQNSSKMQDKIVLKDSLTGLYNDGCFDEFLNLEKRRCKRSEDPEFLMLADLSKFTDVSERKNIAKSMMEVFSEVTRDTDIKGWHVDGLVIGILFTEMAGKEADARLILKHIANKCLWKLESNLGKEKSSRIQISWQSLKGERIFKIHKVSSFGAE